MQQSVKKQKNNYECCRCNIDRVFCKSALKHCRNDMKLVFVHTYPTEDVIIECPYYSFYIAAVDDFDEDKLNHCPECRTQMIY